jgi:hypothetical protein
MVFLVGVKFSLKLLTRSGSSNKNLSCDMQKFEEVMLHDSPVKVHTAIKVAIMSPATGLDPNAVPDVVAVKVFDVFACVESPDPRWERTKFAVDGGSSPGGAAKLAVVVTATAVVG